MFKIVSVEHMRHIEAAADATGLTYATMMQNAGRATAQRALAIMAGYQEGRVTVLVGKGNNGGDGLVAARIIAEESDLLVRCYLLQKRDGDPLLHAARDAGATIADAEDDQGYRVLRQMTGSAHLIVDALFGIGIHLPLRGEAATLLRNVNNVIREVRSLRPENQIIRPAHPDSTNAQRLPYVLAVDCPSGLDCDTGEIDQNAIPADETITFIAAKPGLLRFPGASATGQITGATIGIPADLPELQSETAVLADAHHIHDLLPDRTVDSHKGTYGKALIIGGSANYRGAPGLSAHAAYRIGAGLVTVSAPEPVINTLSGQLMEVTWLPAGDILSALRQYSAVLLGPGWGTSQDTGDLLHNILSSDDLPTLVIDADGLNLLASQTGWPRLLPPNTIITPHPGEMARLASLSTAEVQRDRWQLAIQKAAEWNVVLLLKGAHTLIASPKGDLTVLPFKTDALAKAGSGDVLAGIIVGLLAQGLSAYDAAVAGGYLHGLAGVLAAEKLVTTRSLLASGIIDSLPQALAQVENPLVIEA